MVKQDYKVTQYLKKLIWFLRTNLDFQLNSSLFCSIMLLVINARSYLTFWSKKKEVI